MNPSKTEINNHIIKITKEIGDYCQEKYDLGDGWKIHITFNYSSHRKNQYGGTTSSKDEVHPFISLSLYDIHHYKVRGFREYSSFAKNKVIGAVRTDDWKIYLKCLIAHELSHCVQWYLPLSDSNLKINDKLFKGLPKYEGNHRQFFQAIYSDLRIKHVNPEIDPEDIGVPIWNSFSSRYEPLITKVVI
jgi:hypothetical protein